MTDLAVYVSRTEMNQIQNSQRLRILVVLPLYGGSLPVGQRCVQALKEMGHIVKVFNGPTFQSAFLAFQGLQVGSDKLEYLENSYLQLVSQAVYSQAQDFDPDLVLAVAQAPLTRQVLKRLQKDGVPTAMWFVEDFQLFTYWRGFAPFYDFFAVIQKGEFEQKLAEIGTPNTLYLPLAAEPNFHKPLTLSDTEKRQFGSDISFMGAGYPNRRLAFRRLSEYDFKIWGTEWDGDEELAPLVQRNGERISPDDAVKIFNATKININLHSSVKNVLVGGGDFVNPRTFELACCGAFQLVDKRKLLPEMFAENELATFSDMTELKEQINFYLANPAARQEMANRARARVLKEHTYQNRMQTLLDFIQSRLNDWPKNRQKNLWPEMDEQLRGELLSLLDKLELPPSTDFDTFIWTLRQANGILSPLETALLFLDEWKKQYKA